MFDGKALCITISFSGKGTDNQCVAPWKKSGTRSFDDLSVVGLNKLLQKPPNCDAIVMESDCAAELVEIYGVRMRGARWT